MIKQLFVIELLLFTWCTLVTVYFAKFTMISISLLCKLYDIRTL